MLNKNFNITKYKDFRLSYKKKKKSCSVISVRIRSLDVTLNYWSTLLPIFNLKNL